MKTSALLLSIILSSCSENRNENGFKIDSKLKSEKSTFDTLWVTDSSYHLMDGKDTLTKELWILSEEVVEWWQIPLRIFNDLKNENFQPKYVESFTISYYSIG